MTEKKKNSLNRYDLIREEVREKQQAENEREQRLANMFDHKDDKLSDRLKGENK
jgi:hypothetical protein